MEAKKDGLSVVEFPTATRIHVALRVADLEKSKAFYRTLFGQEPTKVRAGYAKFEVLDPPVNLTMDEDRRPMPADALQNVTHMGIQVKSSAAVSAAQERLARAGLKLRVEESVSCCYAVQDKVWATDPDGNEWEVFVVLDNDSPDHAPVPAAARGKSLPVTEAIACCAPQATPR